MLNYTFSSRLFLVEFYPTIPFATDTLFNLLSIAQIEFENNSAVHNEKIDENCIFCVPIQSVTICQKIFTL